MDGATITTMIGSLGFPIVSSVALFWYLNNTMKEFRASLDTNTKALQELIFMMRDKEVSRDGGRSNYME